MAIDGALASVWGKFGTLAEVRIYLTGQLAVECDGMLLESRDLPGRQGRRAFAFLVAERHRPVPFGELADAIWSSDAPAAWESALSAIVSKLRRFMSRAEADILSAFGCYHLRLPTDAWVDVEVAVAAADEAEGRLRQGNWRSAWGAVCVAQAISRRPFLPGEEGAWIEAKRAQLHGVRLRVLECEADVWLAADNHALAVEAAAQIVSLEPLRETGYVRLMRAHAGAGNRAEALRVYDRCRRELADQLGVDPSAPTEALFLELLAP